MIHHKLEIEVHYFTSMCFDLLKQFLQCNWTILAGVLLYFGTDLLARCQWHGKQEDIAELVSQIFEFVRLKGLSPTNSVYYL